MRSLGRYTGQGGRRVQQFPASQDAARRWCGVTLDHLWLFQDTSSPATDAIGSITLAEVATPTWGVASAYPRVAFRTNDGEGDRCTSSDAYFDLGSTTSQFAISHVELGDVPGANRELFGNRDGPSGWDVLFNQPDGRMAFFLGDGTDTVTAAVVADHSNKPATIATLIDRNAGTAYIQTNLGSQSASLATVDSLDNLVDFEVGAVAALAADAWHHILGIATGAGVEGVDLAEVIRRTHRGLG